MSGSGRLVVKILTPVGSVLEGEASLVLIPGAEGEVGILPGHSSMIFKMNPGVVNVSISGKSREAYFVFGGFAKIHDNELFILVDKACDVKDLDVSEAKKNLAEAEQEILKTDDLNLIAVAESKANLSRQIIEASSHHRH